MTGGAGPSRFCGFLWLVLAVPLLFAPPAIAQETVPSIERAFTAAFVRDVRPQFLNNRKGKPVGFARDVLRDVARLGGVRVTFRVVDSFEEAIRELEQGRIDLIPDLVISSENAQLGQFTPPVDTVRISIFVRQDASQFQTVDDLHGKPVGFLTPVIGIDVVPQLHGTVPMQRRDVRSTIMDLIAGQLDAVVFTEPDFLKAVRQLGLDDRVRKLSVPLREMKRGILVTQREPLLWSRLDNAVRQYVGTPAYERAYRKWYGGETNFWTVSSVAWLIGVVALAGLLASFGWRFHSVAKLNRRLTDQTTISRLVLDNVDQGFTLFDRDLNLVAFNDRFIELLDFPRDLTRVGASFESFIRFAAARGELGPGDVDTIVRRQVEAATRSEPRSFLRPGKNGRTVDVRGKPIPDGGFVTTFTDVTEQMRVEDALRVSEQQLSEAQRIGDIGHWRYLIDTHKFECSEAFYRIYGWDPAEFAVSFEAIADAVHPDDHARVSAVRKQAGKRKEAYRCDFRIVRPDGKIRFVHGEGRPEFDEAGHLVSFFGVNQDITEQKQIEEELLRERTRAELANRAKSEFLANMSHEIRTPLNAIIGFADIIRREVFGSVGNEKYGEYVGDIHASAEHLLDLVNDILDISTIEAGEMPLAPVDLDMSMLFEECTRVIREQARAAKIELSVALPPENLSVYADHRAVRQILLNLLSNAIKFTPPGGEVSISATDSNDIFAILVADTGVGIPAEHLTTITLPFETGSDDPHTTSKGNPYVRSKGTGLGLAIVRSLANLHGGDIAIESEEGVGTTVRVWFPRRRREAA